MLMLTKGGRVHTGFLFDSSRDKLTDLFLNKIRKSSTHNVIMRALYFSPHCYGAVKIKPSPCMVQIASSSPPSGTLLPFLHRSCLLLSDAGFHTLASHVSVEKKTNKLINWEPATWNHKQRLGRRSKTVYKHGNTESFAMFGELKITGERDNTSWNKDTCSFVRCDLKIDD